MIGLYVLKPGYVEEDLEWTTQRFKKAFDELLNIPTTNGAKGLVKYDDENKLLFIPNFLEHNPLRNPNQATAAAKKLRDLPNSILFQDFKQLVEQLNKQSTKQIYDLLLEQLGKPVPVSVPVSVSVSETEELIVQDADKPPEPVFIEIPLKDNSDFKVTESMLKEFEVLYPIQDVKQTLRDIRGWNISNRDKRKTRKGIMSHITGWLQRNHDKGKNTIGGKVNQGFNSPPYWEEAT